MTKFDSLLFYLSIYILSAFFLSISKKEKNRKIDFWFLVAVMLPVLLAAFRDNVGSDFENYLWMYKGQSNISFSQWLWDSGTYIDGTPLGIWLVSRIAFFFESQEVYFGLLALLIIVPIFLFIKNEISRESCFLSAFIFLTGTFSTGLNITKQCIALAFVIYGTRYVFERKLIKYIFCVSVAYCFHPSAIVAVFIYFFQKKEFEGFSFKRFFLILLSIAFAFSISFILENIGGRFASYSSTVRTEFNNKSFYLDLIWLCLFFLFKRNYQKVNQKNELFITLFFIGCIMTITGFMSPYIKRIALYYAFFGDFLIAQTPVLLPKKEQMTMKIIIFAYVMFVFTYSFYVLGHSDIIPYKFVSGSVI